MQAKETATHFIEVWRNSDSGEVISDSGDPLPVSEYRLYSEAIKWHPNLEPICVFWIKPLQEPEKQNQ